MTDGASKAHDYREGFIQGAKAILKAIGDDLPEQQTRVLAKWIDTSLYQWREDDANASPPPLPMIDGA